MTENLIHLDCTLRDGGYYTEWDFSIELAQNYLKAVNSAKIDYAEVGFRFFENKGFKGPFAFCTEDFLEELDIPLGLKISVMINAKDLIIDKKFSKERLNYLVPVNKEKSKISLIRIACELDKLALLKNAFKTIKKMGYEVAVNVTKVSSLTADMFKEIGLLAKNKSIDVVYFADSFGSLNKKEIKEIILNLKEYWVGDIGIHAHDNKGNALTNTLNAIELGVSWVDSTVLGMGRGAGNVKTEELVLELHQNKPSRSYLIPLLKIINDYFIEMRKKYIWGSNPYYYLAAQYSIHPMYVQIMDNDSRYSEVEILKVIDYLKENESKQFSFDILQDAKDYQNSKKPGKWNPRSVFENREVLILGTGPGVDKYKKGLIKFIDKYNPVVIAFNSQNSLPREMINFRIGCHPIRLLADVDFYLERDEPLIAPISILNGDLKKRLINKNVLDFGLIIENEKFEFNDNFCKVPKSLVIAYSLATIASGKVSKAFMAGFDGYPAGDKRNEENNRIIELFIKSSDVSLISITPTNYNLNKKSVFGYLNQ